LVTDGVAQSPYLEPFRNGDSLRAGLEKGGEMGNMYPEVWTARFMKVNVRLPKKEEIEVSIRHITIEELKAALKPYEEKYSLSSEAFYEKFQQGEIEGNYSGIATKRHKTHNESSKGANQSQFCWLHQAHFHPFPFCVSCASSWLRSYD
jgi:hypothetical protein